MIFLELESGLVELTGASLSMALVDENVWRILLEHGRMRGWTSVFIGPEPACRAVLERITNAIDGSSDRRVIRRHVYLPKESP